MKLKLSNSKVYYAVKYYIYFYSILFKNRLFKSITEYHSSL